jgi:zinc protease
MFRSMVGTLTRADVNKAIRRYWQFGNMQIAVITKDAKGLREALVNDSPSPITYKTPKPEAIMEEDREIAVFPVKVRPENVRIVPVTEVFR